jgi:hypothetical protein
MSQRGRWHAGDVVGYPDKGTAVLSRNAEAELHDWAGSLYAKPLDFVRQGFAWKQPGPLEPYSEPDRWQCEFLEWLGDEITNRRFNGIDPVMPIRAAVSSGHGIGKGALTGMLVAFLMSTRRDAKGVITANTNTQLQDKTWAAVQVWVSRCLTAHWFELNTSIMYRKGFRASWKCSPQTCDPDNSEAFAGQHNVASTSFYINDEDSNVPNIIHEVQEGGLTDGEPMQFLFGNPTRRRGAFYDIVFSGAGKRWKTWVIDARTCTFPNKALIADQLEDYGEDSDRFRVRVRGLPPRAEDAQFIDSGRVTAAQKRHVVVLPDEPLVAGCDLAWGGADANVIRFRRGRDARSIPPIRIPGELTRDPSVLTNRLADVLSQTYTDQHIPVTMLFLDSAGIAGAVGARLREAGFTNVREINFGADSPDPKCRYYRDFLWQAGKEWLLTGAIDSDPQLEADMTGPGLREDLKQRIWLESKREMKARGVDSPDNADALFLTFAQKVNVVQPVAKPKGGWSRVPQSWQG